MAKTVSHARTWYLGEWLEAKSLTQARLVELIGWPKSKVSELVSGKQRYNQDIIEELAEVLGMRGFELLMPPAEAAALESLRRSALQIAEGNRAWTPSPRDPEGANQ